MIVPRSAFSPFVHGCFCVVLMFLLTLMIDPATMSPWLSGMT